MSDINNLQNLIAKMDQIVESTENNEPLNELDLNAVDKGAEALRVVSKLFNRVERLEREIELLKKSNSFNKF